MCSITAFCGALDQAREPLTQTCLGSVSHLRDPPWGMVLSRCQSTPLNPICETVGVWPGAGTGRFPSPSNLQAAGYLLVVACSYCKAGERFADKGVDDELINLP